MKVKFTKHHNHWKAGEEVDLEEGLAGYLIRTGTATIETPSDVEIDKTLSAKLKKTKKKK